MAQTIPKQLRFEVFKRDKFTCQYCGGKAPDVLLHADHIKPRAEGGQDDILNLVTSCAGCNLGKGARPLSDSSALDTQRKQLEELQERREQIDMMMQWRDELRSLDDDVIDAISDRLQRETQYGLSEAGKLELRKVLKKHTLPEVLDAIDTAFDQYLRWETKEKVSVESWRLAFSKVPGICRVNAAAKDRPHLPKLLYVQGILRKRFDDRWGKFFDALEEMHFEGAALDFLERVARQADDWKDFCQRVDAGLAKERGE